MSRIVLDGEVFERVASESLYEATLETVLLQMAETAFPSCVLMPFKRKLESPFGSAIPDMVLIDRRLRRWWIVEVELSHHDLHSHVLQQVAIFASAAYGVEDARCILEQERGESLDPASLERLVTDLPPTVLVIADRWSDDWARAFRQHDAKLAVAELYRSLRNEVMLRLNGYRPEVHAASITLCRQNALLGRALTVMTPEVLMPYLTPASTVHLHYRGGATEWRFAALGPSALLYPCGRCPLEAAYSFFEICAEDGGVLQLKPHR